jgi:lysozyme family protein
MKDNFEASLKMILHHEGGYVDHPQDPGGRTNLGVTQAVYEDWVDRPVTEDEMRSLTVANVTPIYKRRYWDRMKGDDPLMASGVDFCTFDLCVNGGTGRGAKMLQKVLGVTQDGGIGPQTLAALSKRDPVDVIENYAAQREAFYRRLKTFDTFGRGWLRRNEETKLSALRMSEEA